ncbi:MAG: DNA-binding protein [Anaerolinea sp.]|nr:DNA-binding protein [Anaerolinea sp.]
MKITVFGGASPQPGSAAYQQAYNLGKMLAGRGHTVATGGYIGTMEAVSRGANEAGGHVIGITCAELERFRPTKANPWVLEEIKYETLHQRLGALIEICDGAFALPGGVGTLAEISVMWNQLLIGAIHPKPLILIGSNWKRVIDGFYSSQDGLIPEHDKKWLKYADKIEAGMEILSIWNEKSF